VPFILFALSGGRIPLALTVMQILAVDLGTDLVPALALGFEPPEPGVMDRPPRRSDEHLISRPLLRRAYFWLGPVQAAAAMAAFYFHYWTRGYWGQWIDLPDEGAIYRAATAMTLAAVVTTQIGNLLAQRTGSDDAAHTSVLRRSFAPNRLVWVGILVELALIALIVYAPPLQTVFGTAAFPLLHWLFLFAWIPALPIMDAVRRAWLHRRSGRKVEEAICEPS
jgi:magnesium-transporting ATPase (P-type)